MALIGGGGAGNVSGGNPSGTSGGLNYIGNHVYGNSGGIGADNSNKTLMEFTTAGDHYIVAQISLGSEAGSGDDFRYSILFNGETIMDVYAQATVQDFPDFGRPIKIVIPSQTKVEIKADNIGSANERITYVTLTGRVYA
jgi:hypothetical protein